MVFVRLPYNGEDRLVRVKEIACIIPVNNDNCEVRFKRDNSRTLKVDCSLSTAFEKIILAQVEHRRRLGITNNTAR